MTSAGNHSSKRPRGPLLKTLSIFFIAGLFTGCTVGPDYKRPEVPVPASWRTVDEASGSITNLTWWQLFEDPTLQELIRTALRDNYDLQLAVARVAEARALLGIARSAQFPELNTGARYHNDRVSETSFPPIDKLGVNPNMDIYRADLDTSFEVDLWGRLRRATEAARAELLASENSQRTVLITLIAEVAQTYFELLELDREAEIDRRTLDSRRASLDLVSHRYDDGLASELDLKRAEEEVASAAATVPDVERRIVQTENRLRILLGENPGPISRSKSLDSEHMPPEIPAGERGLQARQFVETIDRERAAFIKKYFSKQWPNHSLYHLMINSKIGDDAVVETIVRAMECHDNRGR